MFGKNKEPKKKVFKLQVMLASGLPNFLNDTVLNIIIDEPNQCITFDEGKRKGFVSKTASLPFEKIEALEMGEKGNTETDHSTKGAIVGGIVAGTTGAIIGATTGKAAANIPTLKIIYQSQGEQKEITIYQCPHISAGSIQAVKNIIDIHIKNNIQSDTHIDL